MRPVNLIPAEDRRGESAPSRAGALSYVVVGALAIAVLGVAALTLASKSVDDKQAEVASLEAQDAELQARASSLSSFASFQTVKDARSATISSLAESRFDWERVMRELSLVLPERVWLVNLTGTVAPGVEVPLSAAVDLRDEVPGPALEIVGCARSQRDVARMIAAVGDIDGVTRVTAADSAKPTAEVAGGSSDSGDDCRTRNFIAKFSIIAAFDSVPVPPGAAPPVTSAPPPADAAPAPADGSETAPVDDPSVAEGQAVEAQQNSEVGKAKNKVDKATGVLGAGG